MKVNPVLHRWRLSLGVLRVAGETEATEGAVERPGREGSGTVRSYGRPRRQPLSS